MKKQSTPKAAAPKTNLFAAANSAPVKVKAPAAAKAKKPQVQMSPSLDNLATIDHVMDALKARRAVYEAEVKGAIREYFISVGTEQGEQPENFEGISSKSSASCELRKRSTASKLSEDEQELLKENGIPFTEVTDVDVPERFFFNEEILAMGEEVLAQISEALLKIPALKGMEVIKHQPAQKQSKFVTDDKTLDAIFALRSPAKIAKLLDVAGVLAVKPKLNADVAMASAFDDVRKVLAASESKSEVSDL